MVGSLFLLRILLAALYLAGGILGLVLVMIAVSWLLRVSWELFERNFKEQADWLRSKFSWTRRLFKRRKPKKIAVKKDTEV